MAVGVGEEEGNKESADKVCCNVDRLIVGDRQKIHPILGPRLGKREVA